MSALIACDDCHKPIWLWCTRSVRIGKRLVEWVQCVGCWVKDEKR